MLITTISYPKIKKHKLHLSLLPFTKDENNENEGGCVPYNFQNCIKFCQHILLLSEYAKNPKYMSYFNRDKGPIDKVHNKRER